MQYNIYISFDEIRIWICTNFHDLGLVLYPV